MRTQLQEEQRISLNIPAHLNKLPVVEVLPFEQLYTTYAKHRRLQVFAEKGLQCVVPGCRRCGVLLIKTQEKKAFHQGHSGGFHVDVYTDDFHMMTVDHIVPKYHGGENHIDNYQPMCKEHNEKKGSQLIHL